MELKAEQYAVDVLLYFSLTLTSAFRPPLILCNIL